jgi:hypothetical protein
VNILQKIWQGWKRIGQIIGDFIGRFVLSVFYFTLFVPFALGVRIWADPLMIKPGDIKVRWLERTTRDLKINDGRRLS